MKTLELDFKGYWTEENKDCIPARSGVYCVYVCTHDKIKREVYIRKLLYIGESDDVQGRIAYHDRLEDWESELRYGETLCYSFAPIVAIDRERAEAALIFKMQPPFNTEHSKAFIYNDTLISTQGANKFLLPEFYVIKGEQN